LKKATGGDRNAYEAFISAPKEKAIAYFESNLNETIKNLPEDIFGFGFGYDIRGCAQPSKGGVVNLKPAYLYLIGKLLGTHYAKPGEKYLLTGDIRLHTPILRYAMALGFASVGVSIKYAPDFLTTGAHNLLTVENPGNYRGTVQVSGSHGEPARNGFKIKVDLGKGYLEPLYAERLQKLYENRKKIRKRKEFKKFGGVSEINALADWVVETINETLPEIKKDEIVVIDSRAGAAGPIASALLKKRGFFLIDVDSTGERELISRMHKAWNSGKRKIAIMLNMTPDGNMGRGIWDPSKPEALRPTQKLIKNVNADLLPGMPEAIGAVFDGDADRISAVLEDGRSIPAFEMALPYYRSFLMCPDNQKVMMALTLAGAKPLRIACDVRANSKLLSLIDDVNNDLRKKSGINDKNVLEGYFITTGYPAQLAFMAENIKRLDEFVKSSPELKNDRSFMKRSANLKKTYFTAEASGHNFFHISKRCPNRVCDCAISGLITLLNIKETMKERRLTELFDSFAAAYSSPEVTVPIPNDIKIATVHKIGKWMKQRFKAQLRPTVTKFTYNREGIPEAARENDYFIQPKEDGYVVVSGYKIQLKDGRSALVRWSNTSEKLTTIFEGRDPESLASIIEEITAELRKYESSGLDATNLLVFSRKR